MTGPASVNSAFLAPPLDLQVSVLRVLDKATAKTTAPITEDREIVSKCRRKSEEFTQTIALLSADHADLISYIAFKGPGISGTRRRVTALHCIIEWNPMGSAISWHRSERSQKRQKVGRRLGLKDVRLYF